MVDGAQFLDYLVRYDGQKCRISRELYELTEDVEGSSYKKGTVVVLIGGVDDHFDEPGYHFDKKFATVSRPFAHPANFIGVKRKHLELMNGQIGS